MSIRIRVYPQGYNSFGMGRFGMNQFGMNQFGYGGGVTAKRFYTNQLNSQRRLGSLQIAYERQLANERITRARLEERLRNPYMVGGAAGWGSPMMPMMNSWAGSSLLGSSMFGAGGFLGGLF